MAPKQSPFASLKFRDFGLFFWGGLLSEVGSQMQVVAINWQIYEITHSAIALGILGFCAFVPIILVSLPAGLIVDKADRKKVLIFSQIVPAIFSFILALVTQMHIEKVALLYGLVAITFAARTFQGPARQAIIPQLVPKEYFLNAISLNTMTRQIALVAGPAIAGFMIEGLGVQSIYYLNAFSYIIFIISLLPIHIRSHAMQDEITYSVKSVWEGIKFVRSSSILTSTMLLDFLANFFSSATTLLPIFAKDILGVGVTGLGILYAAPSIGAVISGLIIASMGHIKNQGRVIIWSIILYGVATIAFGLSNSFYLSLFALSLVGVGDMVSTVLRNTIRQILTPDHLRGRMTSFNMIFVQGGPQIGETEAGIVAAMMGAPLSVITGGIATVIITAIIALKIPKLRNYQADKLTF